MADITITSPTALAGVAALSTETAHLAASARRSVAQVQIGQRGIGSAIIWETTEADGATDTEATIITNAHVIAAGRSERVTLKLYDGREIEARVVALDPEHDLAALRARGRDLPPAAIGDSSKLRVGEYVIAVGNPFGVEGSVTTGVVAAHAPADPDLDLEPALPDASRNPRNPMARMPLVQADIRLYPGNSGGPLLDARGHVIGVNAMVGGGMGFAVPSNTVARFLQESGRSGQRAWLGIQVQTVPVAPVQRERLGVEREAATLVIGIEPDGPAEKAGILMGDILLAVDGRPIASASQLVRLLNQPGAAGQPRTLDILRGGQRLTITLTPELRAAA